MISPSILSFYFFFFNDTATTEIYTLSLHDALPISSDWAHIHWKRGWPLARQKSGRGTLPKPGRVRGSRSLDETPPRSEEHTSELQSHLNLVCRLLLEKKKDTEVMNYDYLTSVTDRG